ncbi:MAG: helix-turn-helix domain-containing protein [Desulfitobacteriaceae bacterium]
MAGEGEKLRIAREKKAWSLLDAEDATKIRARYLEALETEKYEIIPGTAYVKGFLQTYAKHLDLNPGEILALFKSSQVSDKNPVLSMPLTSSPSYPLWWRPAIAVIIALLVISVIVAIAHWSQPHSQAPITYTPAPLPSEPKQNSAKETDPSTAVSSDTPSSSSKSPTPSNTTDIPETEGLIAQIVFNQPCWLLVKTDGKVALQGEYHEGTTKELIASSTIEFVTVGNAGGISVTLNGLVQPSMGSSGQVVNNVVLTKKDTIDTR